MTPAERYFLGTGRFECDGVTLGQVLAGHPPPLYLYSAGRIRDQYRKLTAAFPGFLVCYSFKANPNPAILGLLAGLGAGAEVSSAGELRAALAAGFAARDTVLVGPAKTDEEIRLAIEHGIAAVVCDCPDDLERLEKLCREAGREQDVLLRVNTREQPLAREKMVGGPGKFGFDEEKLVTQVRNVRLERALIRGIQVYSGSQALDPGFLSGHFEYVIELALRLRDELEFELGLVDFGGGFGIPYAADEPELDLAPVAEAAQRARQELAREFGDCRLLLESGRFITAEAGVFITRVQRVKRSRGRSIIITDSGMNGFSRPVFMQVQHPVRLLSKPDAPAVGRFDVCGPICTPLDCLARDVELPEPEPGDPLGVFLAGAYGYTMSLLNFMSRRAPAELLADRGSIAVIRPAS
ncbi:alanine racemase [candidate division WOR-3 bacterium]|nr:alanine racemase [candidate division WOR-3 bacterium]